MPHDHSSRPAHLHSFTALVKREVLEHRGAMIYFPVIIAATLIAIMFLASSSDFIHPMQIGTDFIEDDLLKILAKFIMSIFSVFSLLACLIIPLMLVSSLYSERQDRSILFWKSMPVSDMQTVLAKLLGLSIGSIAIANILAIIVSLALILRALIPMGQSDIFVPALMSFGQVLLVINSKFLLYLLYALPVYAWLLLASALSSTSPLILGIAVPVAVGAIIHYLLDWSYLKQFFMRLLGFWSIADYPSNPSNVNWAKFWHSFLEKDLWIGLLIALAFFFAAVLVRKNRSI